MVHPETAAPISRPSPEVEALTQALLAPFDVEAVKFKPAVVSGTRALALPYVDARAIQDRLDEVLGVAGWQDEYEFLPDGSVVCRLRLRLGDEWITKMDVGGPSEQPDEGDRRKAAVSDALKRAAVKFGVGRYLYRLPQQWVDYDPQKKTFARRPTLPPSALPAPKRAAKVERANGAAAKPAAAPDEPVRLAQRAEAPARAEANGQTAERPRERSAPATLPANGAELQQRLYAYDAQLAKKKVWRAGELVKHIQARGVQAGFDPDLANWSGPAILLAVEETRAFEAQCRAARPAKSDKREVA
jgi:hypothetical protein